MDEMTRLIPAVAPYAQRPLSIEGIREAAGAKEQAREVGRHFEALLIEEAVKAARSAGGGWLGEEAGEISEATAQMGEEFLAKAIASGGGLGLAALFSRAIEAAFTAPRSEESGGGELPQKLADKTIRQENP